jgi:hypothetical protein
MQDLGDGLRRIPIPRHSVNKRLSPRCSAPAVARRSRSPSASPLQCLLQCPGTRVDPSTRLVPYARMPTRIGCDHRLSETGPPVARLALGGIRGVVMPHGAVAPSLVPPRARPRLGGVLHRRTHSLEPALLCAGHDDGDAVTHHRPLRREARYGQQRRGKEPPTIRITPTNTARASIRNALGPSYP